MKPKTNPFLRSSLLAAAAIGLAASSALAVDYNWGDTVTDSFSINATDVARDVVGGGSDTPYTFNNNTGDMGIYWRGSLADRTFIHFDLSTLQGTTITGNTSLNYTVNATWGGVVTGSTINTADTAWTYSNGGATPAFTPISGATNATGSFTTGQVATWSFGNTVMQGFVDSPSTFYGLVLNGASGTSAHLTGTPTLTGTYTVGEVRVLNGTDWNAASYDNVTNTLSISGSSTVAGGKLSLATGTTLAVSDSATLGSGSFSGTILNNGTISYASSSAQTLSGAISGSGSLTKSGAGTLTLSGANTHNGTTLTTGTLIAELSTTKNGLGSGAVSVGSGTTLQLNNLNTSGSTVMLSNAFSSTGTLILSFAAGTTGRNTMFTSSSLSSFTGAIQLTSSGATGDKMNLAGIGTVNASLLVNNGQTVFTGINTGANVFSGGTTISGNGNSEGMGAIRMDPSSSFGGNVNLAADAKIQGGNTTTSVLSATVQSGVAGTQILTVDGNFTASGAIGGGTGTLAVQKTGTGSVTFSNTNTYTGGTTVTNGTLTLGHATDTLSNSGAVNVNGGTLAIGGNSDSVGTVTLTGGSITGSGGTLTGSSYDLRAGSVSAILGGSAAVTKSTSGEVTLTGANSFTGGINLNEGIVAINGDGALGTANGAVNMNGGTLKGQAAITLGSGRTITLGTSGGYVSNGYNQSWTINSKLTGEGFIGFNYDSGTGQSITLTSTTNDYSGETRIGTTGAGYYSVGAAILKLGATNALPYGSGKGNVIVGYNASGTAPAQLDLNGNSTNINGLSTNSAAYSTVNNSSATAATLTLGNGDATASFGGVIQDTGSGALSLVKTGSGTQTLSGTNTYEGSTTVNAGTLAVSGSIANSAVTVNNAGTVLASGSTGTIGKGVTVNNGAILAAGGRDSVVTASVGSDGLNLNEGSIFEWNLASNTTTGAGTNFDSVSVTGNLAINETANTGSVFKIILGKNFNGNDAFWLADRAWDVFSVGGASTTLFQNFALFNASDLNNPVSYEPFGSFSYTFASGTGSLNWSAVPEPTTALAGLLLTAGLLRRRRP